MPNIKAALSIISIVGMFVLVSVPIDAAHKQKEATLQQRVAQLEQHAADVDAYLQVVESRLWDLHDRLETIEQAKHTAKSSLGWTSGGSVASR